MLYIWPWSQSHSTQSVDPSEQAAFHSHAARDMRITAFALGMITITLTGLGYGLFGLGTLPPTVLYGLNMFPYLGGVFFSFVAIGLSVTTMVMLAKSGMHSYQKGKWAQNRLL